MRHEQLAWFPPLAQSMADNDKRCSAVLGVSPMSDCIKTIKYMFLSPTPHTPHPIPHT
ncbi:MAG: hypothetical protein F6K55_07795 [Moorea sp. SIO4A3]|nr:hypothetical protein [Moorena sp. SIO4A3]